MFKSNLPDWFDPSRQHYPIRPDNVSRGKEKAPQIAETVKQLHQVPDGPYSEWKTGRPSMDRTNLGNNIKDIEKHRTICRDATLKSLTDPTVLENRAKGYDKKGNTCQGPDGTIYSTTAKARDTTGINVHTLRSWCKKELNGWKYIKKENK